MRSYGICIEWIINNYLRFNAGSFLGELIGPVCAGYLSSIYGFDRAVSIMGLIMIIFSLLFIPVLLMSK